MPFPLLPVVGVILSGAGLALALRKPKIPPALAQAAVNAPPLPAVQPKVAQQAAIIAENPDMSDAEAAGAVAAAEAMAAENTRQFVKDQGLQERRSGPIAEQARDAPRPIVSQALPVVVANNQTAESVDMPGISTEPDSGGFIPDSLNPFV
jgi:hypothetical protein